MELESKKSRSETHTHAHGGRRKMSKTKAKRWGWVILAILIVGLVFLILGLTVFKAKRPTTTVNSVSLRDFQVSFQPLRLRVLVNITLDANIAIDNPNRVSFHYDNTSAVLKYRGQVVGEVPLPAGEIGARQTVPMNITLTLLADRLLTSTDLYSDVMSGTLPLTTYTRVTGYVRILFKIHVVTQATCDLYVDVSTRSLANQTCHYKTKL